MAGARLDATQASPRARFTRVALHIAGLVAAGVIAWLLWQGYRQPGFIFDVANVSLC